MCFFFTSGNLVITAALRFPSDNSNIWVVFPLRISHIFLVQVILDFILDTMNVMLCSLGTVIISWRMLSYCISRQSTTLCSDCNLCFDFCRWWFNPQFNSLSLVHAGLHLSHVCVAQGWGSDLCGPCTELGILLSQIPLILSSPQRLPSLVPLSRKYGDSLEVLAARDAMPHCDWDLLLEQKCMRKKMGKFPHNLLLLFFRIFR